MKKNKLVILIISALLLIASIYAEVEIIKRNNTEFTSDILVEDSITTVDSYYVTSYTSCGLLDHSLTYYNIWIGGEELWNWNASFPYDGRISISCDGSENLYVGQGNDWHYENGLINHSENGKLEFYVEPNINYSLFIGSEINTREQIILYIDYEIINQ